MKHIISLGAGVQSSTMALMAAHGEITPMPDCAIFADTGAEPEVVYQQLNRLVQHLPFPVYWVVKGNLEADSLAVKIDKNGTEYTNNLIPAFIDKTGLLGRKCTADYKVAPIRRKIKELLGLKTHSRWPKDLVVTQWLGISFDEMQRMKVSVEAWMQFRHPLVELRMTRGHCLEWMRDNGYPEPSRSACYFCPFHSNEEWNNLSATDFQRAVKFEKDLQSALAGRLDGVPYLHRDGVPLDKANLITAESAGQISWLDECAGMCGT